MYAVTALLGVLAGVCYFGGTAIYATLTGAAPENPKTPLAMRVFLAPSFFVWRAILLKRIGGGGN